MRTGSKAKQSPDAAGHAVRAVSAVDIGPVLAGIAKVCVRYDCSATSIARWIADERIAFPPPVYIGRYRYWRLDDLEAWEHRHLKAKAA